MKRLLVVSCLMLLAVSLFAAESVRFAFDDPNPRGSIDKYTLYWDTDSGEPYANQIVLTPLNPNPPEGESIICQPVSITLPAGQFTLYATVTATGLNGIESGKSNEVSETFYPSTTLTPVNVTIEIITP